MAEDLKRNAKARRTRSFGRVTQPDRVAIAEDADGHAGLAEKSLEFLVGGGNPAVVLFAIGDFIQRGASFELADDEDPRFGGIGRVQVLVGRVGLEDFAVLAGGDAEAVGHLGGDGENGEQLVFPAEEPAGEEGEMANDQAPGGGISGKRVDQALLRCGVIPGIELDLAVHQCQRRDDESVRLEVAKPALVLGDGEFAGIRGHGAEGTK